MAMHNWTEKDETHYREWVNGGNARIWEMYGMPELRNETDAAEETWPLWAHALFMIGLLFACGAFWIGLVWLLFFRS